MAKKFEVAVDTAGTSMHRVEHEVEADGWEVVSVGGNRMEMLRLYASDGAEDRRVVFATPVARLLWIWELDEEKE